MSERITIIGAGLAGCSLAWCLYKRGCDFILLEDEPDSAGSLVAAGMLAPVTGRAFNPSWQINTYYDPARSFYSYVEKELAMKLWHFFPVVRLFHDAKDRKKFEKKREQDENLDLWVHETLEQVDNATAEDGAVVWKGSGRLNVGRFVKATRAFFARKGYYSEGALPKDNTGVCIHTKGARGLIEGSPIKLPQRSAKGEILTVRIPELSQERILSRGMWLVPTGENDGTFLAGASYEWDDLTNNPTQAGRAVVEKGIRALIKSPFEVLDYVAGVRPIVRRSEPVIGRVSENTFIMNGLGSKGVLYAPRTAEILIAHILEQVKIPDELEVAGVLK